MISGYYFVREIPRGAYRIHIFEQVPSENTLALTDENGKFCLNEDKYVLQYIINFLSYVY